MRTVALLVILAFGLSAWADDNAPAATGGRVDETERLSEEYVGHNYLANGGFDDPAFKEKKLNNYDGMDEVYECTYLPGWEIETVSLRNGIVEIVSHDEAGDNAQYARMRHYTLDGWAWITLTAKANGLVPGHEYVLDMYVSHKYIDSNSWANPDHGFNIYGKDAQLMYSNHGISKSDDWQYLRFSFTPADDEITLELWSQNFNGDGNKSGQHTVSWDQIRIYDPENTGIATVASDTPGQVYTLQGIPVNPSAPLHGIYLVKRGEQVTKTIFR